MDFAAMNPARPPPLSPWASEHTISPKPPPYDSLYDISPPAPVVPLQGSFPGLHSRLDPVFNSGPSRARPPPVHQTRPAPTDLSISHLREALNSLDSKVASLLSERDVLESRLESAVRLQSPVHRLPSELLASMFVTAVTGSGEEDSWTLSTIMLVCRHWNEIASNIPDLWCRVVAGIRHPLAKVQLKLERSKSIPLHICVDFSPKIENGTVTTESIVRTMDLLRTSIWRWKTFRLIVPNRPQAHAALMRCTDGAPLLELLSIRVSHSMQDDHHYSTPPRPLFEGQTPSLTSCSLTSFNFGWDIRLVSRLRTLNLSGYWNGFSPSVDVILSVLRACPQLEEIALRNMSDVDGGSCSGVEPGPSDYIDTSERPVRVEDNRMIHLPRLVKASFYYSGTIRTRTILSLITCPALEWVDLCFLDNVSPMIEELRRQSLTCLPLRHLRIESSFFSEMKLLRLLQRVPSLNTLELVDVEDASSNLLKVRRVFYLMGMAMAINEIFAESLLPTVLSDMDLS